MIFHLFHSFFSLLFVLVLSFLTSHPVCRYFLCCSFPHNYNVSFWDFSTPLSHSFVFLLFSYCVFGLLLHPFSYFPLFILLVFSSTPCPHPPRPPAFPALTVTPLTSYFLHSLYLPGCSYSSSINLLSLSSLLVRSGVFCFPLLPFSLGLRLILSIHVLCFPSCLSIVLSRL